MYLGCVYVYIILSLSLSLSTKMYILVSINTFIPLHFHPPLPCLDGAFRFHLLFSLLSLVGGENKGVQ
jgi:hypothetical protein